MSQTLRPEHLFGPFFLIAAKNSRTAVGWAENIPQDVLIIQAQREESRPPGPIQFSNNFLFVIFYFAAREASARAKSEIAETHS
jgi:hypothetical protein